MKKSLFKIRRTIFITCFFLSPVVFSADHLCTDCHSSATPNVNDLIKPLSALCADCHAARIATGEHQVDIPVNVPGNTLPLHDGKITCITCHDPHKSSIALRMTDPELCAQCHTR